jgi:hypothetical protein
MVTIPPFLWKKHRSLRWRWLSKFEVPSQNFRVFCKTPVSFMSFTIVLSLALFILFSWKESLNKQTYRNVCRVNIKLAGMECNCTYFMFSLYKLCTFLALLLESCAFDIFFSKDCDRKLSYCWAKNTGVKIAPTWELVWKDTMIRF